MKLRIVCVETEYGRAANIGGPVAVAYKTFDLDAPPELATWLSGAGKWLDRGIRGVEVFSSPDQVEVAPVSAPKQ